MDEKQLSLRLEKVASYIPKGARLADIGSDHGYLPVSLAEKKIITFAIAGEVVEGPYQSTLQQVKRADLEGSISVRKGDGLAVIQLEDQLDVITICGMGGGLIASILENGDINGKLTGNERLILQPNVGEKAVRTWLINHQYQIIAEELLEENSKLYEIIVAEKHADKTAPASAKELTYGFYLREASFPLFKKKWLSEIEKRKQILDSLVNAQVDQSDKISQIKAEIIEIEEMIK